MVRPADSRKDASKPPRLEILQKGKHPIIGMITDFDLATSRNKKDGYDSTGSHRTGTLPFMAAQLLKEPIPPHVARFDLESLLYVATMHILRYPLTGISQEEVGFPFEGWFQRDSKALYNGKLGLATIVGDLVETQPAKLTSIPSIYASLRGLEPELHSLQDALRAWRRKSAFHRNNDDVDVDDEAKFDFVAVVRHVSADSEAWRTLNGKFKFKRVVTAFLAMHARLFDNPDKYPMNLDGYSWLLDYKLVQSMRAQ